MLNSIDDPDRPTKKGEKRKLPKIAATIFHRSKDQRDTLPYAAFGAAAPRGFLPELRTIDTSAYDASTSARRPAKGKKKTAANKRSGPPPIHVHHKFIVIDGDTDSPTIYTGSPNFSKASEQSNDENVLEIKGNAALGHAYVAEFMRLYNHYPRGRSGTNTTKAAKNRHAPQRQRRCGGWGRRSPRPETNARRMGEGRLPGRYKGIFGQDQGTIRQARGKRSIVE